MTGTAIIAAADITTTQFALSYLIDSAATAPSTDTYTDGYQMTLTWQFSTPGGAAHPDDQLTNVCMQYLDADGNAMANTDTVEGLPWVCVCASSIGATGSEGDLATLTTGLALRTFTHAEYNCYDQSTACTATLGGGTALPSGATVTNSITGTDKVLGIAKTGTFKWYQPNFGRDYASALRRYSPGDKVRGWNVEGGAANVATTVVSKTMMKQDSNVITLAGATALAATGVLLGATAWVV